MGWNRPVIGSDQRTLLFPAMKFGLIRIIRGHSPEWMGPAGESDSWMRGPRCTEVAANCGQQRVDIQWLGEEFAGKLVCSRRRMMRQRRDDKNRQMWALETFVKKQIPTADVVHAEIRDQQIRLAILQATQRGLAAFRRLDIPSLGREDAAEAFTNRGIVVDEKDRRAGSW